MMQTKRLVYYSYDSRDNPWCGGGGAYRDWEVLKRMTSNWKSITLYVGHYPGFKGCEEDGIKVCALGFGQSYLISRISFSLVASLHLLFQWRKVIGNSLSIYAPVFTILLFPKRSYMVMHHHVGKKSLEKLGIWGWIPYWTEIFLFRFLRNAIISNSSTFAYVKAMNPSGHWLKSANGMDLKLFTIPPRESHPPFILFLGRFDVYMKGLDILIQGFARTIKDGFPDLRLILAGKASPENLARMQNLVLENEVLNRVDLLPNITEEKKEELLSSCLFFCSPSRFEGWGIAALEANAAGKAVVVSDTDGFRDSIKKDLSGIFIPVEDVNALCDALKRLAGDRDFREQLGDNARQWAMRFTWEGIAKSEADWMKARFSFPTHHDHIAG